MKNCSICLNEGNNHIFAVKEMLQGTRKSYDYFECDRCHCLQLVNPPKDMRSYYNNLTYGSFQKREGSSIKSLLRKIRNNYSIRGKGGFFGRILSHYNPLPIDFRIIGQYAQSQSRILDVGCGWGNYVDDLQEIGYRHAEGIDPFIEKDIYHKSGARVRRINVDEVEEKYDVILSHHSLEHAPQPLKMMESIKKRLKDDGVIILTVPVAEDLYGLFKADCYLIQAPQHFFLFSLKSIEILMRKTGLVIERTVREIDSNLDWYKISYLWSKNMTVQEFNLDVNFDIPKEKLIEFDRLISDGKRNSLGDNVVFILRKY